MRLGNTPNDPMLTEIIRTGNTSPDTLKDMARELQALRAKSDRWDVNKRNLRGAILGQQRCINKLKAAIYDRVKGEVEAEAETRRDRVLGHAAQS